MNKKKLIILISIIIVLAILACVGIFALSGNKANKIADKLDMGEKYLEELEYEKALAVYKEILKIDPKNVDAYLGMADAYIAMGEYEEALDILEEGYEETESRKLEKKIEEVEALTTSGSQGNSEDDNLDPRFKACVVDGVYHNGYSLYDLTEDENNLLSSLIQFAQQENRDEVLELLYSEQLWGLMENHVQVQEREGIKNGAIWIAFEEYKIYFGTISTGKELVIIPLNDGTGYYFQRNSSGSSNNGEYCRIATLTCRNGMFNGEFVYEEISYHLDTREVIYQTEITGNMVNGLLDGKLYERMVYFPNDVSYYVNEYEEGISTIVKEEDLDGEYRLYNGYATDENWIPLENYSGGRYSVYMQEADRDKVAKYKYTMPHSCSAGMDMDNGGKKYYPW